MDKAPYGLGCSDTLLHWKTELKLIRCWHTARKRKPIKRTMDEKEKAAIAAAAAAVVDPIEEKDREIAKLKEERDNYRTVALTRKGKLPADSVVLGDDFDAFLDEKVKSVIADKEILRKEQERTDEIRRITKENSELRLALKNRPEGGIGGDSGSGGVEVKDNVFSAAQIEALRQRAVRLKADPEKFIENAKKNFLARK